jgi:hypothetical protein
MGGDFLSSLDIDRNFLPEVILRSIYLTNNRIRELPRIIINEPRKIPIREPKPMIRLEPVCGISRISPIPTEWTRINPNGSHRRTIKRGLKPTCFFTLLIAYPNVAKAILSDNSLIRNITGAFTRLPRQVANR